MSNKIGVTAGVYVATLRHSLGPAIAVLTTLAMYVGELVLMGGELFRFGRGMFFDRLGVIPFSLCDFLIIGVAGAVTRMIGKRLSGE